MSDFISVQEVKKTYTRGKIAVDALRGVSLAVSEGAFLAFMGPSGCGKTTLLNLLGGLDRPTTGSIVINGTDISALDGNELAIWRSRNIGFIFQLYNLMPVLTAVENVELPLLLSDLSPADRRKRALGMLEAVGLDGRAQHLPAEMSGGQQQRVAIARALATDPMFIIADEPTGDLDSDSGEQIMDLLQNLHTSQKKTIIMVTHDKSVAQRATHISHMKNGMITGSEARQ